MHTYVLLYCTGENYVCNIYRKRFSQSREKRKYVYTYIVYMRAMYAIDRYFCHNLQNMDCQLLFIYIYTFLILIPRTRHYTSDSIRVKSLAFHSLYLPITIY
jgi:hypothetical protein